MDDAYKLLSIAREVKVGSVLFS